MYADLRQLLFRRNIESYIVNEGDPFVIVSVGVSDDKEVGIGRFRGPSVDQFFSIAHNRIEIARILVRMLIVMLDGTTILNEVPMVAEGGLADKTKQPLTSRM